jgi:nitrate/nitrite-specific signal transduction histidine kinase
VSDDAIGITDEMLQSDGMGLRIMSYRAGLIHGKLDINLADAGGALVSCVVMKEAGYETNSP